MKKSGIYFSIAVAIVAASVLAACVHEEKKEDSPETPSAIPVRVIKSELVKAPYPIVASGLIASSTEARLSFKTGGVIRSIYVKEGDAVKKGQLLASLDLTEIGAMNAQANEGLMKAERDFNRATNLYRDSVATLEQFQNAKTAFDVAKEQMQIAQFNRNYSEIRATTDGRIVKKLMNEGEMVGMGMPVFFMTASGASDWLVKVGIADKDWALLQPGDIASVQIDAYPDESFSAVVQQLSQSPDPMSGLYQAELKINTKGKLFATGLFARAEIVPHEELSYTTIPVDALLEGNGQDAFVFLESGNKAKRVAVKVAFLRDGNAYLRSGLEPALPVITSGSAYLTDGVEVSVVQ